MNFGPIKGSIGHLHFYEMTLKINKEFINLEKNDTKKLINLPLKAKCNKRHKSSISEAHYLLQWRTLGGS